MARTSEALLELAKLIGLLETSGALRWMWFVDPIDEALSLPPERRQHLGKLLRALHEPTTVAEPFASDRDWEPIAPSSAVDFAFGPVWSTEDAFELGLGAQAEFAIDEPEKIKLAVLAGLVEIAGGTDGDITSLASQIEHALGQIHITGSAPIPVSFLKSLAVEVKLDPSPQSISLTLDDEFGRSCELVMLGEGATTELGLDLGRLGAFALVAWLHEEGNLAQPDSMLKRLDSHLLPLVGGCGLLPTPIGAFPIFDGDSAMGKPADFAAWADSIVTIEDDGKGPMTALWHLRALITGNESRDFFSGSCWLPLHHDLIYPPATADSGGLLGDNTMSGLQKEVGNQLEDGVWLGIEEDPGVSLALVLRLCFGDVEHRQDLLRFSYSKVESEPEVWVWVQVPNPVSNAGELQSFADGLGLLISNSSPPRIDLSQGLESFPGFDLSWDLNIGLELTSSSQVQLVIELGPTTAPGPIINLRLGSEKLVEVTPPKLEQVLGLFKGIHPALLKIAEMLSDIGDDILDPNKSPSQPPLSQVIGLLAALRGNEDLGLDFGPLGIGIKPGSGDELLVSPRLTLSGFTPGPNDPVHVGGIEAELELAIGSNSAELRTLSIDFTDLRLGALGQEAGVGLIGELLPDLRELRGIDLGGSWSANKFTPRGGGKIPIQQAIGPFELSAIEFSFDEQSFDFGLDGEFSLGGVIIAPQGLGFSVPLSKAPGQDPSPSFRLDGLGLSFEAGGVGLTGMFANMGDDFIGAAVLSCFGLFELSAIGGYAELQTPTGGSEASLFVFAALDAPIGGAPWCFVTGLAAGFGYNRRLPTGGKPADNVFLSVMKDAPLDTSSGDAMRVSLNHIAEQFTPERGQFWVAAGVEFTSFAFIDGKLVLALGFNPFAISLVGSAAFGLEPVAFFELDFQVTVDADHFELVAELSRNSYLLHPDLFGIHGGFGLAIWWGGPKAGDFVLTVGGYHPGFPVPPHYPQVDRIGVKAVIYGVFHLAIDAYFAITPRAMMAGASASLWGEVLGIEFGLDVYVDVLIEWDPFYIQGEMGVVVWVYFLGRHEIGAHLKMWTPPLGGHAVVDLDFISFEVVFGSARESRGLNFHEFLSRQLQVPASSDGAGATVDQLFAGTQLPGLLSVDIPWGRAVKEGAVRVEGQEGLQEAAPIEVQSEFGLTLRSKIPAGRVEHEHVDEDEHEIAPVEGDKVEYCGEPLDFPLCKRDDHPSTLSIEVLGAQPGAGANAKCVTRRVLVGEFPDAHFGEGFKGTQAGETNARQIAADEGSKKVVFLGAAGISLDFEPELFPEQAGDKKFVITAKEEPSTETEAYPLALGPRSSREASSLDATEPLRREVVESGDDASNQLLLLKLRHDLLQQALNAPLKLQQADLPRATRPARLTGRVSSRASRVPVPASPPRSMALAEVSLRVLEPRALQSHRITRERFGVLRLPKLSSLLPRSLDVVANESEDGAAESPKVDVPAGKVVLVDLVDDRAPFARGQVRVEGEQRLRAVFLGRRGGVCAQRWVDGEGLLSIPRRARRLILIGEGDEAPVDAREYALEAVGVETESLLIAATPRTLVGPGCVVEIDAALPETPAPLDLVPGEVVLAMASRLRLHAPVLPEAGALVLVLRPTVAAPRALDQQLAGFSLGATLGEVQFVAVGDRVAAVFPVECEGPWSVEIEVEKDWRLTGVAAIPRAGSAVIRRLQSNPNWDLVDDRWSPSTTTTSTVHLELAP